MATNNDSRAATLRPLSCELSTLHNCDGSAEWKSGKTNVLAAIHGPIASRLPHQERADRCVVSVSIKADWAVPDWEILVKRVLSCCIRCEQYPRCVISVVLQVLHSDGSELAAMIQAAVSALLDASIDMHVLPVAVTVHPSSLILDPSNRDGGDTEGVVFVFGANSQIIACTGIFVEANQHAGGWLECCQRAERAVPAIRGFWRLVMEQKLEREANTLWAQS
jgi:ribonuclease PH